MLSETDIGRLSERHGVSPQAVRTLAEAIARGKGIMAQFSHPDLGGMGQWMASGPLMIGRMFDDELKGRVSALCKDIIGIGVDLSPQEARTTTWMSDGDWWPADLGSPSSVGAQNTMRYAFFPEARRLVVDDNGSVTIYDTGDHDINGVSQQQSATQDLRFSSSSGPVDMARLKRVA